MNNPQGLFIYAVKKLLASQRQRNYSINYFVKPNAHKTHNQWASIIFGGATSENIEKMSIVKTEFSNYFYFSKVGKVYGWNINKIKREFPIHFGEIDEYNDYHPLDPMLQALDFEIEESKKSAKSNIIVVKDIMRSSNGNGRIYEAVLAIDSDEEFKLVEDLPFTLRIGGLSFETKVLDFNKLANTLYFQLDNDILGFYGVRSIIIDASWILIKLRSIIQDLKDKANYENLILKFLNLDDENQEQVKPNRLKIYDLIDNPAIDDLDNSQMEAYNFTQEHDFSIIWGPPGTGKSHTLASIIYGLFLRGEKTHVCCIANVAVDAIANKLVNLIAKIGKNIPEGQILRIGYTLDKLLLETPYLFPNNEITNNIRDRILTINQILDGLKNSSKGLDLKAERQNLQDILKNEVNDIICKSLVTFSTASKYFVDEGLRGRTIDNLIIDEASMLSIPHLIALGYKVKKRIIITGDFRQLGPVVLSQSYFAREYLHKDIFEFCGVNPNAAEIIHPALKQLTVQRRSHELICSLFNKPFYRGLLSSESNYTESVIIDTVPFPGRVLTYKAVYGDHNKVEFTRSGSRFNESSAKSVLDVINEVYRLDHSKFTIGIITPYRGQVKYIQELLSKGFSNEFLQRIEVGTIHSFQGSERDIIIFDTVECRNQQIGRLYKFNMGKRLVNVALSRAKYKLIVCGDLDAFDYAPGHSSIDSSVRGIFRLLKQYRV